MRVVLWESLQHNRGACLKGTKDITPEQIKQARDWQKARYDNGFRKQLGLLPEKS